MMRSKEIFTEVDRKLYKFYRKNNTTSNFENKMYNALLIAEAEIEELREKLHNANTEISSLIDLRPEN
jgi:hypothetical protein